MSERNARFKLTVHYDGAAFRGWQAQPSGPTVQGELERAVAKLAGGERRVLGAGRTDAGVHACGQVAAVDLPASWTGGALARSLNALLPDAVWVERAEAAANGFDPRREAVSRTYVYRVGTAPECASPFRRRWCWPLGRAMDMGPVREAAAVLPGKHDFRAFAKAGQPDRGHLCTVEEVRWREWEAAAAGNAPGPGGGARLLGAVFEITANRFLHRMVRYLVGTMARIGLGARPASDLARLLQGDPNLTTSPPAPPQGLFLAGVAYRGSSRKTRPAARAAVLLAAAALALPRSAAASPPDGRPAPAPSAACLSPAPAATQTAQAASDALAQGRATAIVRAARRVAPAVVAVSVLRRERVRRISFFEDYLLPFRETRGLGSGFVVEANGTVLTNHHVVENAAQILVTLPDGRDFPARLAGTDPETDVAVLFLEGAGELPAAPLGTAEGLLIGEWTVAIGNPFGSLLSNPEPSVTAGVVSAVGRHIVSGGDDGVYLGMIQTDAAINPGNSGGPLVNGLGEVVGVNTSILSRSGGSEGLGFAIPIDRALRVAEDLVRHGAVRRAWTGLEVDAVEADGFGRSRGVRVARVAPGSPAAAAGVRGGTRLLEAAGRRMTTPLDFAAVMLDMRPGDRALLVLEGPDSARITATRAPSSTAARIEVLRDLEAVTVTAAIRSERRLSASGGALVVKISEALARVTGLAAGDVILAVNNRRLRTADDAAEELRRAQRRQRPFVLVFERDGRTIRTGRLAWT